MSIDKGEPRGKHVPMLAHRVLLFTDAVDSTWLTGRLGDEAASALWAEHDRRARRLIRLWRGIEIDKSDGFLLVFESVDDAAGFAQSLHGALAGLSPPIRTRASIHLAPMVQREVTPVDRALGAKPLELDGLGKSLAARVMAFAAGGQTLLTSTARAALVGEAWRTRQHGYWQFKGIAEPMALWELAEALVQRGGVVRGYAFPDDLKKRYARCGRSSAYQPQACG